MLRPGLTVATLLLLAAPAAAQLATVDVLKSPDVVVTSASRQVESGLIECGPPCRPFSARVLVRNLATEDRSYGLWLSGHVDPADGPCDLRRMTPMHRFSKSVRLGPGESVAFGGGIDPTAKDSADTYWPSAIYNQYAGPASTIETTAGMHGFCVFVVDMTSGVAETCEAPCVRASKDFDAFVRTSNEAPFGAITWTPLRPQAFQEVTFRADVQDNDTVPKRDTLTVTWDWADAGTSTGPVTKATFGEAGEFKVTATLYDGFDRVRKEFTVTVTKLDDPPPTDGGRIDQPLPWTLPAAAALCAALLRRRTR